MMKTATAAVGILLALALGGCNNQNTDEVTAPSATVVDTFTGNLTVKGTVTHPFTMSIGGQLAVTLLRLGGEIGTVAVGLGIGTFAADSSCTLFGNATQTTPAGALPQISGTTNAGTYCLAIYDVGNLEATTDYLIVVAHP